MIETVSHQGNVNRQRCIAFCFYFYELSNEVFMNTRKLLLVSALMAAGAYAMPSMAAATTAVTGDQSSGDVVFTGYVPGFVAGDAFTVTGLGGVIENQYTGELSIAKDGTFSTMKPVVLEGHDYDKTATPATVGDLHEATWEVKSINASNPVLSKNLESVKLVNNDGTEVTSADVPAPISAAETDTLSLTLTNDKAMTDDIAGQVFTVDVVLVATAK
jgi:hypothetical protein